MCLHAMRALGKSFEQCRNPTQAISHCQKGYLRLCTIKNRAFTIVNTWGISCPNGHSIGTKLAPPGNAKYHYNRTFEKKSKHPRSQPVERLSS